MAVSGSIITTAFSFINGIALATITSFIGLYVQNSIGVSFPVLAWTIIPVAAFAVALGLNSIVQLLTCSSVNIKQVAMNSVFSTIFVALFLLISLIPVFRGPVEGILPNDLSSQMRMIAAYSFFMFWAGMFGEGLGAGFAQSCSKS